MGSGNAGWAAIQNPVTPGQGSNWTKGQRVLTVAAQKLLDQTLSNISADPTMSHVFEDPAVLKYQMDKAQYGFGRGWTSGPGAYAAVAKHLGLDAAVFDVSTLTPQKLEVVEQALEKFNQSTDNHLLRNATSCFDDQGNFLVSKWNKFLGEGLLPAPEKILTAPVENNVPTQPVAPAQPEVKPNGKWFVTNGFLPGAMGSGVGFEIDETGVYLLKPDAFGKVSKRELLPVSLSELVIEGDQMKWGDLVFVRAPAEKDPNQAYWRSPRG